MDNNTLSSLHVGGKKYSIFQLNRSPLLKNSKTLPFCLKILLENLLRHEKAGHVSSAMIQALCQWSPGEVSAKDIAFTPARVVLQDFTGVPAIVDLAAMRDAMVQLGGNPDLINPLVPVDLVVDHSVMVDYYGTNDAIEKNIGREFSRNRERYAFLRWGQQAFRHFRVVPPGTGIVHQVNLEYLAQVVTTATVDGKVMAYPDTLVGTDSHTTMINGLGVLGWGVGGIEAEAAMLGQPMTMLIPKVVGVELTGRLSEGTTATDLVLTITELLRQHGVVGKFVEFWGEGLHGLHLADRATIANMAPEYGATIGIFPIDHETLNYLRLTGRSEEQITLVEAYAKVQGLWRDDLNPAVYDEYLRVSLAEIEPSVAGPKRPQDRVPLALVKQSFQTMMGDESLKANIPVINHDSNSLQEDTPVFSPSSPLDKHTLVHGDIVIAAITSCTNTSNPAVMLAAGLVAKKACQLGLLSKPWVKTSLAPGSQVVPAYLKQAGLTEYLNTLGFNLVGFGCTTCIGNSGPLHADIQQAIHQDDLTVASVLSGNRNFEGRIHPEVKANYLASPPLVVAYALAGTVNIDLTQDALGHDPQGNPVLLKDIWPSQEEVNSLIDQVIKADLFTRYYADVFKGSTHWQQLSVANDKNYTWPASSYIKKPTFFNGMATLPSEQKRIIKARCLVKVGNSITTDHISPAGSIHPQSPAGIYLQQQGVTVNNFNSLGSRRGNHEVMMRGTFANPRLENSLALTKEPNKVGGYTCYFPDNSVMPIYDAAIQYAKAKTALIILAGKEYGTGSSRDWAAKGTQLLGVKAVIAESFERIHRSNLVGFGVLPLVFMAGENADSLGLTGEEVFDFEKAITRHDKTIKVTATIKGRPQKIINATNRIDTESEWDYYLNGSILHTVLRKLANGKQ
ncbi:MAG: aconitate hydratase [Enterobacterales bacterium]|jgi:aconitate hydratase